MEEIGKGIESLRELKGAKKENLDKSLAKQMGIKSTLITQAGVAISSFIETTTSSGKKIPNIEILSSEDGAITHKTNFRALKGADVSSKTIKVYSASQKTQFANPSQQLGADYIGVKQALENKFFGKTFIKDNVHVQIAYNVLDLKKHLIEFINQVIYIFYNINRVTNDYESYDDLIGTLYTFSNYTDYLTFCNNNNKDVTTLKNLLKGVSFYDAYFPNLFKLPKEKDGKISQEEIEKCDAYNFDILRLLSLMRQSCEHENMSYQNNKVNADVFLYDLQAVLNGYNQELLDYLDDLYTKVPAQFNADFEKNSKNNLYILSQIYPSLSFEELVKKYYNFISVKEQKNLGVNLRLTREIIIDRFLSELRDKKYDTNRSKLYTVLDFVISEILTGSKLIDTTVQKLRVNTTEDGRIHVYLDFATQLWGGNKDLIKFALSCYEEERQNKFKSIPNKPISVRNQSYALGKQNVSYFSKLMLLLTKFLDGKEINVLLNSLISRLDNIADLIDCARECGVNVEFKKEYETFNDSRKIAKEIRLIKNVAKMKPEATSIKNCMIIDAVNFLGVKEPILHWCECTTEEQKSKNKEFLNRIHPPKENNKKVDHKLRNFIINNVVKSRYFIYLARYTKHVNCRAVMQQYSFVKFVLNEIPDAQIVRYHKSVKGYQEDNIIKARNVLSKMLANFTVDELFDKVENWDDKQNKSTYENSQKQKSRALIRLYLTVAYLGIKNLVNVNTIFSMAFSCLERDYCLKQIKPKTFLELTESFLSQDEILVNKYNQLRDSIRDSQLSKQEKKVEYKKQLVPILKEMHYDLHSYYCVKSNCTEAKKIIRKIANGVVSLSKSYRDCVAHLNVIIQVGNYLGTMQKITSYYDIFVYCLQKYLIDNQMGFVGDYNDDLSSVIISYDKAIKQSGFYNKNMLWLLNVPFAYNLARYKNLSIADLFYGKPTKQTIKDVNNKQISTTQQVESSNINVAYNVGDTVVMDRVETTLRGGLRGYIKNTNVKIAISPKTLKGTDINKYQNASILVTIVGWDQNAQVYNAKIK